MGVLRARLVVAFGWRMAVGAVLLLLLARAQMPWWALGMAAAAACALVAWWCVEVVREPVETMTRAARKLGAGEEVVFPEPGFGELDGLAVALAGSARGVERRLAAGAEMTARLQRLLDAMQDAVVAVDAGGRVTWSNAAMQRLVAEFSGALRPGQALVHAIRAPEVLQAVEMAVTQGGLATSRNLTLHGRTLDLNASPMPDGGAVLVLHDMTRVEQVERTHRDFVANVSHELRTPLTSIHGYAEMLLEEEIGGLPEGGVAREFAEGILKSARRMVRLTNDLLAMARVESGEHKLQPARVEAGALLREAAEAAGGLLREKDGVVLWGTVDAVEVLADGDAMVQVLTNLMENALNYGSGVEGALVELSATAAGEWVRFGVRDWGPGIAFEHQERLFERFYRVDKARSVESGGTGLGLTIARHLVEEHGGEMGVESELGRGSLFWFTLRRG